MSVKTEQIFWPLIKEKIKYHYVLFSKTSKVWTKTQKNIFNNFSSLKNWETENGLSVNIIFAFRVMQYSYAISGHILTLFMYKASLSKSINMTTHLNISIGMMDIHMWDKMGLSKFKKKVFGLPGIRVIYI